MKRHMHSPPRIYGFWRFLARSAGLALLVVLLGGLPRQGYAEALDGRDLPLQFDLRERIARPDLTAVPRIRFLTTVDFPPFNFIDQTGKLSGFHVDLAREICRELKVLERCQIEALSFADLQKALDRGEGEVIAAGIAVTPERRKSHAFSRAFLQMPARFAFKRGASARPAEIADLDGKEVGIVAGTAHEAMMKSFFPAIKPRPYKDTAALLAGLKSGEVTAVFGDGRQLSFWVASSQAGQCCMLAGGPFYSREFLGEGLTLMLKSSDKVLQTAMDHALLALSRSGRLAEIYLRYFPNGM